MSTVIGRKFTRWVVVAPAKPVDSRGRKVWLCECECGVRRVLSENSLKRGASKSCGCLQKARAAANAKHGHARASGFTPTYKTWKAMLVRCTCKTNNLYGYYGGRGITVCDQWASSFENFLRDMGERPPNTTLDRIDNDKGYAPNNCRWADIKTQRNNTSRNRFFEYAGERLTVAQWSERTEIPYHTLKNRLTVYGWPVEKALTQPVRRAR